MMHQHHTAYRYYLIALAITAVMFLGTTLFVLLMGKTDSFLLVNSIRGHFGNIFFKYVTHLGDGWVWLPAGIFFLLFKRKYLWLFIFTMILSVFFAQFSKRVVFSEEMRPTVVLSGKPVETIAGVPVQKEFSFPSGHSTTSFTLALVLAYVGRRKWLSVLFPLIAFMVAWSRVYQGQHFVSDVAAGMLAGMAASFLAIGLYRKFIVEKKSTSPNEEKTY